MSRTDVVDYRRTNAELSTCAACAELRLALRRDFNLHWAFACGIREVFAWHNNSWHALIALRAELRPVPDKPRRVEYERLEVDITCARALSSRRDGAYFWCPSERHPRQDET